MSAKLPFRATTIAYDRYAVSPTPHFYWLPGIPGTLVGVGPLNTVTAIGEKYPSTLVDIIIGHERAYY